MPLRYIFATYTFVKAYLYSTQSIPIHLSKHAFAYLYTIYLDVAYFQTYKLNT